METQIRTPATITMGALFGGGELAINVEDKPQEDSSVPAVNPHEMVPENRVFTYREARAHWARTKAEWTKIFDRISQNAHAIENEKLRKAVFLLRVALFKEQGAFVFAKAKCAAGDGPTVIRYSIENIDIYDDIFDQILELADTTEDVVNDAGLWFIDQLQNCSAPFLRWGCGPIEIKKGHGYGTRGARLEYFSWNRMVVDLKKNRLAGVETHYNPAHRQYKIVKINPY